MNGYAIALIGLVIYLVFVLAGRWLGVWKRLGVSFYGPIMMLRTRRGSGSFRRVGSRKKFWRVYGWISVAVVVVCMVAMTVFLVWEVFAESSADVWSEEINPDFPEAPAYVTITYVVSGLVVAVVAHEFAHGFLTTANDMRLESMGTLILLIPIGAFAEPNDSDLKSASEGARMRLYSSGPGTNMLLAFVCLVFFIGMLASSISPVQEGAIITDITDNSPADLFGIPAWCEITYAGGLRVTNATDLMRQSFGNPGDPVKVSYFYAKKNIELEVPGGIVITRVLDGPALNAGLTPGMIIASLNASTIPSVSEFTSIVENTTHEAPVNITVLKPGYDPVRGGEWFVVDESIKTIRLTSKWVYYYTHYPDRVRDEFMNQSLMGVSVSPFGVKAEDPDRYMNVIARPLKNVDDKDALFRDSMRFVTLPFVGYSPLTAPYTDLYEPAGPLSFLPQNLYWALFNFFYWAFWINFMLGLANALPALPMDGGYVLKDILGGAAKWRGGRLTGLDKALGKRPVSETTVEGLVWVSSVIVALLFLWLMIRQVFGPL